MLRVSLIAPIGLLGFAGVFSPGARGAAPLPPMTVFLLAGQSNMAGRAPADGVSASDLRAARPIAFDYVCSFAAGGTGPGAPDPHHSDGWVPLGISPRHRSTPGGHFGPEIGFGLTLARQLPPAHLAIVKHGRGGTDLAEDWAPGAVGGRQLYAAFLAQARSALARLRSAGTPYELGAFVWVQGEADATRRTWAEQYEANLTELLARVRADFGVPRLPALIVLTADGRRYPQMKFAADVRAAQRSVVRRDRCAALVSGDDLSFLDAAHYDAAGQLELGRRLAEAYLRLRAARSSREHP